MPTRRTWIALAALIGTGCAEEPLCAEEGCVDVPPCAQAAHDAQAMFADVAYLAAPERGGRVPGTAGDDDTRALIRDRFSCLGLTSFDGTEDYEQPFTDSAGRETANVLATLPGADLTRGEEAVVITAHTDHLGRGRLGANDNASGVAALLAIAAVLADGPPPARTVVFAALGSEELGMEGAYALMDDPPAGFDPSQVVYNLNMDMIGTYDQTEVVWALGAFRGTEGAAAVQAEMQAFPDLDVALNEPSDLSDNAAFCERGIPYLFLWSEDPRCYHEACDTPDRLDVEHMVQIAHLTGNVAATLANSEADLRGAVEHGRNVCDG
jgi:hypothetical protein